MNTDHMVFKSHHVDRGVDKAVLACAERFGATQSSIFRLCVDIGLAQLSKGAELPPLSDDPVAARRPAHIRVASDERLRVLAYHRRLAPSELRRRVSRLGMLTLQAMAGLSLVEPSEKP